eukprot:6715394-Prymnesium_polylepis.1
MENTQPVQHHLGDPPAFRAIQEDVKDEIFIDGPLNSNSKPLRRGCLRRWRRCRSATRSHRGT